MCNMHIAILYLGLFYSPYVMTVLNYYRAFFVMTCIPVEEVGVVSRSLYGGLVYKRGKMSREGPLGDIGEGTGELSGNSR